MFYLNIDKVTKVCMLHSNCYHVRKFINGELSKKTEDGFWTEVKSEELAKQLVPSDFSNFIYKKCGSCGW